MNLIKLHVDCEKSAHNALLQIFTNCKSQCFDFNSGRNWFRRHIQQHKILSIEYLNNDSQIGKWIKCFLGSRYLPPDEVLDGFYDLMPIVSSTKASTISIFLYYNLENFRASELHLYYFKPKICVRKSIVKRQMCANEPHP